MMDLYRGRRKSGLMAHVPAVGGVRGVLLSGLIWIALAGVAHSGGVPDVAFFRDYMAKKAATFLKYNKEGIQPYLDMTLENNTAFMCITPDGREVDFEGYLDLYTYTFGNLFYQDIELVKVAMEIVDEDSVEVTYTLLMVGRTCAGPSKAERLNVYTWQRIRAGDEKSLRELNPKNLDKYFAPGEDRWIVTEIRYR